MAKRGRPIKEEAMREHCNIRMNDDDLINLKHLCEVTGKNKTEVIKQALKVYSTALEVK